MPDPRDTDFTTRHRGDRIAPQNIDAERSVLAAAMLKPELVEEIVAKLIPEEFYRPSHRYIFQAIVDLYNTNIPVDQLSVAARLEAEQQLKDIGGKAYLTDVASDALAIAHWSSHADIVKRTYMLRELIRASTEITTLAYEAPDDLDDVVEQAEKAIFRVTNRRVSSNFQQLSELLTNAYDQIEKMHAAKQAIIGVPSGFSDLDNLLSGMRGGDLVILAARPAVGKTSFALNLAVNAAKAGTAVAIFSLEMGGDQLAMRMLASEARVDLKAIRSGSGSDADWQKLAEGVASMYALDVWVDDTPSISIMEIRAKARRQLRNKSKGLIIVDYLQLMQPQGKRSENRQVEIAEISRGLKILAKELDVPVIALSQLSRAVESRAGKRPMLSDLRESGAIEQDADIVMFLDRNLDPRDDEEKDRPAPGTAELIIAKHRNGPTGVVKLVYLARYTKFVDHTDRV